eukprot:413038-Prorocentrum_lima.AAC.1
MDGREDDNGEGGDEGDGEHGDADGYDDCKGDDGESDDGESEDGSLRLMCNPAEQRREVWLPWGMARSRCNPERMLSLCNPEQRGRCDKGDSSFGLVASQPSHV